MNEETINLLYYLHEVVRDLQIDTGELSEDAVIFDDNYDSLSDLIKAVHSSLENVADGTYDNITITRDEDGTTIYFAQPVSVGRFKYSGDYDDDVFDIYGAFYDEFNQDWAQVEILTWACENKPEMIRKLFGDKLTDKLKEIL